jgi:hypothetical protein
MKMLILLLLYMTAVVARPPNREIEEIQTDEIRDKMVSVVQDIRVGRTIEQTPEFKKCRDDHKFKPGDDKAAIEAKARAAETCFQQEIAQSSRSEADLKRLSDKLELEAHGLVKSRNLKEISNYLGNKMYEKLTGINREEKNIEKWKQQMQFKNRKLVDQEVFIKLQQTMIVKNTLLEISRFCYDNLRIESNNTPESPQGRSFDVYWQSHFRNLSVTVTDLGKAEDGFGQLGTSSGQGSQQSSTSDSYKDIFTNIGLNQLSSQQMSKFYEFCMAQIQVLCKAYTPTPNSTTLTKGANACLARERLKEFRKASQYAAKIQEDMEKNLSDGVAVQGNTRANFYNSSTAGEDANIDAIATLSSRDLLEGGASPSDSKVDDCIQNPNKDDCKDFISIGDEKLKAQLAIDQEMTLKREIELARVKELLKIKDQKLDEYLKENGYLDLAKNIGSMSDQQVLDAISNSFTARREALIAGLNEKVGSRQMTEAEESQNPSLVDQNIKKNAEDSKTERARLAQVVLFNNIITSHLNLKDQNGNTVGSNVGAWKREERSIDGVSNINSALFQNLKDSTKNATTGTAGEAMTSITFLDEILSN